MAASHLPSWQPFFSVVSRINRLHNIGKDEKVMYHIMIVCTATCCVETLCCYCGQQCVCLYDHQLCSKRLVGVRFNTGELVHSLPLPLPLTRDHHTQLHNWVLLLAQTPSTQTIYKATSFLRVSELMQFLLDTLVGTSSLTIHLEPLLVQGL